MVSFLLQETAGIKVMLNAQYARCIGERKIIPAEEQALVSSLSIWHLDLQDPLDRSVNIEMCQSNDVVFGKGTIVGESVAQNATAIGTIKGNKLNLDILSSDLSLVRLELTMRGKFPSGDHHASSASFVPWAGFAMGRIQT